MYEIIVRNVTTNVEWVEYGFSKHMMKRINYLNNHEDFEIIWVFKLCKTWDTFKKCLKREEKLR
jgi:hypothetical protein